MTPRALDCEDYPHLLQLGQERVEPAVAEPGERSNHIVDDLQHLVAVHRRAHREGEDDQLVYVTPQPDGPGSCKRGLALTPEAGEAYKEHIDTSFRNDAWIHSLPIAQLDAGLGTDPRRSSGEWSDSPESGRVLRSVSEYVPLTLWSRSRSYSYCTASTMLVLAAERAGGRPAKTPIKRPETMERTAGSVG